LLRYRDFPVIAACAIAVYFVVLAWPGVSMNFAPDDMQNLYTYWEPGPWKVMEASLLFATPFYRPLAGLYYLPLFHFFGLNPAPYRVVMFGLLCANVWLLYAMARRVTGSRETGAFAVLLGCFHASAAGVCYSTAMIYEVLCFGFLCATLLVYARARAAGRLLNGRELILLAVLFACALDAKEMAVVAPVLLAAYELIYGGWRRPSWRVLAPIAITGAMSAAYVAAKLSRSNSLLKTDAYQPVYTWARFMATSNRYAGYLFFGEPFTTAHTVLFWLALFGIAAGLRRRGMWFGAVFALFSYLPLNFVPPRDGFVLYIPLIGFAIYAADFLSAMFDFAAARFHLAKEYRMQAAAVLFALLLAGLSLLHAPLAAQEVAKMRHAQSITWHVLEEFKRVRPHAGKGARILLVDSPIDNDWDMYFIAKLYFNDHGLRASWVRPRAAKTVITGEAREPFDQELRWVDDRLIQVK
jgi:hypothetical protein